MNITETRPDLGKPSPAETAREAAPKYPGATLASMKVHPQHLERLAIVYIRQSSPQQVRNHRESRERQYALSSYAMSLGWLRERVSLMDDDQGQSGTTTEGRDGFQRLLAEVTMDHVGIIVGLEMSRLSRCDKDWHHLLEVCGIFGTLVADQDGVYDVSDPNDRLLLGLKGMIGSVELQTMRNRMEKAKLNKAERGELFFTVPIGYVKLPGGGVALDPDEQVRSVVRLIFDKFVELGTGSKVFEYLLRHDIRVGVRVQEGPNRGQLEWRRPCRVTLYSQRGIACDGFTPTCLGGSDSGADRRAHVLAVFHRPATSWQQGRRGPWRQPLHSSSGDCWVSEGLGPCVGMAAPPCLLVS